MKKQPRKTVTVSAKIWDELWARSVGKISVKEFDAQFGPFEPGEFEGFEIPLDDEDKS